MRTARVTWLSVALFGVIAPNILAQTLASGSIAGVVKDTTGAVLPGVTVEASSPVLIEKVRTVVTDSQGAYKIVDLRPGLYTVTFSLTGFSTVKREGLELTTGFTATANAELRVGAVNETITVTGASPIVDTQNVRSENVLSREALDSIPTAKAIPAFAALTLGVTIAGTGQDVGGDKGELATTLTIHGGRGDDERQMIDGMKFNTAQLSGGGTIRYYWVDQAAAQEVTLETSGISAESETGGVQVNVVPKDGGNSFKWFFDTSDTSHGLQANNLTDALTGRGLTSASSVKKIYDIGAGVGPHCGQQSLVLHGEPVVGQPGVRGRQLLQRHAAHVVLHT